MINYQGDNEFTAVSGSTMATTGIGDTIFYVHIETKLETMLRLSNDYAGSALVYGVAGDETEAVHCALIADLFAALAVMSATLESVPV